MGPGSRLLAASALLAVSALSASAGEARVPASTDVWCFDRGWYPGRADGSCHPVDKELSAMLPIMALPPLALFAPTPDAISIGTAISDATDGCPLGYDRLRRDDGPPTCAGDVRPAR